jgi:hypothetical protein
VLWPWPWPEAWLFTCFRTLISKISAPNVLGGLI